MSDTPQNKQKLLMWTSFIKDASYLQMNLYQCNVSQSIPQMWPPLQSVKIKCQVSWDSFVEQHPVISAIVYKKYAL